MLTYIKDIDFCFTIFFRFHINFKKIKLQVGAVVTGFLLTIIGLAMFFYGLRVTMPEDPLSGSAFVVIGAFLGMAGFLVLVSHVFRGSSIFT